MAKFTTKTGVDRVTLDYKTKYNLTKLVVEGFVSSGLNDKEFADNASALLKTPITESHVRYSRLEMGIYTKEVSATKVVDRIKWLETQVEALQERVRVLER